MCLAGALFLAGGLALAANAPSVELLYVTYSIGAGLGTKDIDEVVVAGSDAYQEAKDFMRMLMPSHAKNVKLHRESYPIFAEAGVEAQLDAMFSNHVTLKSGGYLVINQTEALVAIDVNSGRSTREHNIEDTALRTNLEAADEVARQLRLRDLAGLPGGAELLLGLLVRLVGGLPHGGGAHEQRLQLVTLLKSLVLSVQDEQQRECTARKGEKKSRAA